MKPYIVKSSRAQRSCQAMEGEADTERSSSWVDGWCLVRALNLYVSVTATTIEEEWLNGWVTPLIGQSLIVIIIIFIFIAYYTKRSKCRRIVDNTHKTAVLFCSLAVLDPRVGHTVDVLSQIISVLCYSDRFFQGESCPRIDVVHPGRAWSSSPACTWRYSLHYLFSR